MKIIEQSAQRLSLRLFGRAVISEICTIDRDSNVVVLTDSAFCVPYRRRQVPLSLVTGVSVMRRGGRNSYYPVLELRVGRNVSIGAFAKAEALEAARTIREFLKGPT
ncbi:MAG: hypothetical protein KGJ79_10135 [Alphaproteobacteria bacterium]|nr:hypothetical protein [Alphaproteobacteria bacterium]MDE2493967.1 hypothetical protein [Alphaproteobacteria bacterium]